MQCGVHSPSSALCASCLSLVLHAHCLQGSLFNVRVSFPAAPETGVRFSADEFGVTEALITNAVEGAAGLLTSLPRVLYTRSFIPFYDGRPSGIRLLDVTRLALALTLGMLAALPDRQTRVPGGLRSPEPCPYRCESAKRGQAINR